MQTVISTKLTDNELKMFQAVKGDKSTSAYLKELILADSKRVKREVVEYEQVISSIAVSLKVLREEVQKIAGAQNGNDVLAAIKKLHDALLAIGASGEKTKAALVAKGFLKS